jgi:hypothetical protein
MSVGIVMRGEGLLQSDRSRRRRRFLRHALEMTGAMVSGWSSSVWRSGSFGEGVMGAEPQFRATRLRETSFSRPAARMPWQPARSRARGVR